MAPLTEPVVVTDVYVSGAAYIEETDKGIFRMTLYTNRKCPEYGTAERMVVSRFVFSSATWAAITRVASEGMNVPLALMSIDPHAVAN